MDPSDPYFASAAAVTALELKTPHEMESSRGNRTFTFLNSAIAKSSRESQELRAAVEVPTQKTEAEINSGIVGVVDTEAELVAGDGYYNIVITTRASAEEGSAVRLH